MADHLVQLTEESEYRSPLSPGFDVEGLLLQVIIDIRQLGVDAGANASQDQDRTTEISARISAYSTKL